MKMLSQLVAFARNLVTRKVTKVVEQAVAFVPAKVTTQQITRVGTIPHVVAVQQPVWVGYKRSPKHYIGERGVARV